MNSTTSSSLDSDMERVHGTRHSYVMGRVIVYLAHHPNGGIVCRRFTLLATNSRLVNEWGSPAELRQQVSGHSSYEKTTRKIHGWLLAKTTVQYIETNMAKVHSPPQSHSYTADSLKDSLVS